MKTSRLSSQRGVVLVVTMLFLMVITVVALMTASNSALGLRMSANIQDSYESFQSAEAGVLAVMSLSGTAFEPFDGNDSLTPFAAIPSGDHPLRDLNDGPAAVDVDVYLITSDTACPPRPLGYSADLFACDYYRIVSEHEVASKARTKVELGAVKTIIGKAAR